MSTAHRPNFAAAKGRESKFHNSQRRSHFSLPQHTKLKFRQPSQSASTSSPSSSTAPNYSSNASVAPSIAGPSGTKRRDLKRELEMAEWEAKNKRRAKQGLEPLPLPASRADEEVGEEDEEEKRRREAIAKAIELDRDSSEDDDGDSVSSDNPSEANPPQNDDNDSASSSSESDSESGSDSDSEDEQTQLLLELEKIKAERLAEKTRLAQFNNATETLSRQEEIARGNPLLNLQNAFQRASPQPTEENPSFAVSKRWDHDVIFKNQASAAGNTGRQDGKGGFVNDLTRSEFHRKFMNRYIK
ncbi:hypothetical protein PHBOTO_005097 [Pseudozyma hubeiensis]|nr:hypothetical protein PHBOTO_005097 [Pseudozyma hubeiensis]